MKYKKVSTNSDLTRIRYIEIDNKNDVNQTFFGFALDERLKVLGRVVIDANIEEYERVSLLVSKGCNMFCASNPQYGNYVIIDE